MQEPARCSLIASTKYSWYTRWRKEWVLPISGKEMLKRFQKAGWQILSRRGSHVKVGKRNEREIIPMHKELKKGLEQKLLKRLQSDLEG